MRRTGLVLFLVMLPFVGMDAQSKEQRCDYSPTSFSRLMKNVKWQWHPWNFQYPSFMTDANFDEQRAIDEYCGILNLHTWGNVELCYWPLRSYAVAYPDKGTDISPNAKVSIVTYSSKHNDIYSGYTEDGRIFYMKMKVLSGDVIDFASTLVLIYPKEYQPHIEPMIDIVHKWEYKEAQFMSDK